MPIVRQRRALVDHGRERKGVGAPRLVEELARDDQQNLTAVDPGCGVAKREP